MLIAPMAAMINPVYAWQNNGAVTAVNAKTQPEDDNESTKPNAYQLFGYGDTKMDSLSTLLNSYSVKWRSFTNNSNYETLKNKARGFSKPTPAFYDNDTLRRLMSRIDQISSYFKTHSTRDLQLKRDSLGQVIGNYFKTPKFVAINSGLQKKYHIDPAKSYDNADVDYRQYHDQLFKKMSADIKADLKELKILSEQVRDQMQAPENVAYLKQLPALIDSIKNYYKTPHIKQYDYSGYEAMMDIPADERRKAQAVFTALNQDPEIRRTMDKLNQCGEQMRYYYKNTPAVKDREDAWKNELRTILADDYDNILHPGHGLSHLFTN